MKTIKFSEIKALEKHVFSSPGIYIIWSGHGKALYVGRTQNIRSRLMQHRQIIELGNSGGITKFHDAAFKSRGGHRQWRIDILTYDEARVHYHVQADSPAQIETELIGKLAARLNTMDRPVRIIGTRNLGDAAKVMALWRAGDADRAFAWARAIKALWNAPQFMEQLETAE